MENTNTKPQGETLEAPLGSMSPTPLTDDFDKKYQCPDGYSQGYADDLLALCRKIERNLTKSREKIKRQAARIRVLEGATNHALGLHKERDELFVELAEARETIQLQHRLMKSAEKRAEDKCREEIRLSLKPCGDCWLHLSARSGKKASINLGQQGRMNGSFFGEVIREMAEIEDKP